MIQVSDLKLPYTYSEEDLWGAVAKKLRILVEQIESLHYLKKSIDARKKPLIYAVVTVLVSVKGEGKILRQCVRDKNIQKYIPI